MKLRTISDEGTEIKVSAGFAVIAGRRGEQTYLGDMFDYFKNMFKHENFVGNSNFC